MAAIILGQVGAAAGAALLPNGLGAFGLSVSGAAIGQALGGLVGGAIDRTLAPPLQGPRIASLQIMESREGAGIARIYGRMRLAGQVIWASRFREKREEQSGGKGGPKYTEYSYCVSFAVALCEGPITRIERVWANGKELPLDTLNWRLYNGHETQLPDPLIEAIEGSGAAPAYRGLAYIVFEDLPLDAFGNRLPQLTFEVVSGGVQTGGNLPSQVRGVNIIPASGEFVYSTRPISAVTFPAIETSINMNNGRGQSDFAVSLSQLQADLPNVHSAALTVAWFGNDVRAGQCRLRPGVETRERTTRPYTWRVDGVDRQNAHLISRLGDSPNYGGTPCDQSVIEAIAAMRADGLAVTLSPFILMDIPPDNDLPDPNGDGGQAAFPWRGRITVSADGTAQARAEIGDFVGNDGDYGFRHFILHQARLAVESGGVDAFLIGSEMVGLTRIRDETGAFPFIEALIAIASEAREILGPDVAISYAADWTEYGAYVPADDTGDVLFPMDALWAHAAIDFVGIDWYPPIGDWRDGDQHIDALAGYAGADDPAYLRAHIQGGEAYDWYYASDHARDAQIRTPIDDTAYNEGWVFRQKDLPNWRRNVHHERFGGVRALEPTAWQAAMKPVRLIEIGYPAVDRGGNAPNLFYDPKSSESALPPYSQGLRDDLFQRAALSVALTYWQNEPGIEQVLVWAWDGRPWPYYPVLEALWSDGPNWQYGHWLNGRMGFALLSDIVADLCSQAGLDVDTTHLRGFVDGYLVSGQTRLRDALEPLRAVYQFDSLETERGLSFQPPPSQVQHRIGALDWLEQGYAPRFQLLEKPPGRLRLTYIDADAAYAPALAEAYDTTGDPLDVIQIEVPLVLSERFATDLAARILANQAKTEALWLRVATSSAIFSPGDVIALEDTLWRVENVDTQRLFQDLDLKRPPELTPVVRALDPTAIDVVATLPAMPELLLIDPEHVTGDSFAGPIVAVTSNPWTAPVRVEAGADMTSLTVQTVVSQPAGVGQVRTGLAVGPQSRWDDASTMDVFLPNETLQTVSKAQTLNGQNRLLVEGDTGWELMAYCAADLVAVDTWQISGLLRGLSGSPVQPISPGARLLKVDDRLQQLVLAPSEHDLPRLWRAGASEAQSFTFSNRRDLPMRVGHLRAKAIATGWRISWTRRAKAIMDSWELPESDNLGDYIVELWGEETRLDRLETSSPNLHVEDGTVVAVRVAQRASDKRIGQWLCIALEST